MSPLLDLQRKLQDTSRAQSQLERALAANPQSAILRLNLESVSRRMILLEAEFKRIADSMAPDVCTGLFRTDEAEMPTLRGFSGALQLFLRGFVLVLLVASNTYQIAHGYLVGATVVGFLISLIWWHNARAASQVERNARNGIVYALGAAGGTLAAMLITHWVYS